MTLSELILPEFEEEMAGTRRVLERVPNDKLSWKAHPKSNTIGWVASHLVEIPGWVEGTMTQTEWDVRPAGGEPYRSPQLGSREEMLAMFDQNVATASRHIKAAKDEDYDQSWSLLSAGEVIMTMPRLKVIRTWVINHSIHHRAFLCAYLRLNDIPVPGLYGPSGDE